MPISLQFIFYRVTGGPFQDVNINLKSSNGSHCTQNKVHPPMTVLFSSVTSNFISYTPLVHCAPALMAFFSFGHTKRFSPSGPLHTRTSFWNALPHISSLGHSLWFKTHPQILELQPIKRWTVQRYLDTHHQLVLGGAKSTKQMTRGQNFPVKMHQVPTLMSFKEVKYQGVTIIPLPPIMDWP